MRRLALTFALLAGFATSASAQAEVPKLTIAAQTSGTVNWELQTIISHGFDKANGFELVVIDAAGLAGGAGRLSRRRGRRHRLRLDLGGAAARRRPRFRDDPYSKAVGGVMVPADSKVQSLADLKGTQIGIAGGPVDKSWIILRALALKQGFDIAADTTQVFGAPPIIFKAGMDGEVAGVVNFWNFMAKQKAAGMREVISVDEATRQLGLDPDVPLLGYVVNGKMMREQPQLVAGLAAASRAAKDLLATDDAAWEALRPLMNADNEAEFEALRAGWRAGIPAPGPVNEAEVAKLLAVMADLGGEELVGKATTLPEGVFAPLGY